MKQHIACSAAELFLFCLRDCFSLSSFPSLSESSMGRCLDFDFRFNERGGCLSSDESYSDPEAIINVVKNQIKMEQGL